MMFFYWWVLIQIVVESLPVSSSGHQKLFEYLLHEISPYTLYMPAIITDFKSYFVVQEALLHALHIPTLAVIALFFYSRWSVLLYNWVRCLPIIMRTILFVAIADCVTTAWYIFLKIVHVPMPLWVGFFITACLLFSLKWCPAPVNTRLNLRTALFLGFLQGIALISGISRFAITLVGASWLGFNKRAAFETSFMIQVPLIMAASVRGLRTLWCYDLLSALLTVDMLAVVAVGMVGALLLLHAVSWLYRRNLLWLIGIYMIVPVLIAIAI